jgi:TetR/AcrR family fatty acid metabolism transcriptional regulator
LEEFQRDKDMAVVYQAVTHQNIDLVREQIKEVSKMYLDMVSEILEKGQAEGTIRKDLYVGLAKRFILGAVESVISNWLHSRGKYDLVSMTDPLMDLFIRGIGNYSE